MEQEKGLFKPQIRHSRSRSKSPNVFTRLKRDVSKRIEEKQEAQRGLDSRWGRKMSHMVFSTQDSSEP